jgi:mannose-6-phosphate isomerase-like protein (cupin superfamily)
MKASKRLIVAGLFGGLIAAASLTVSAAAQTAPAKLNWTLHLNETRGPIRTADVSALAAQTAVSEILGGPTSGSDNAYLIYTKMAPGAHGPALFTLPVDHYYVVLSGKMNVQIGTDKFVAGPLTAVVIPANTPHEVWNDGTEPEAHLEVIASANPDKDLSRNLMSMLKPAQPKKVENAAKLIREIKVPAAADLKPGLNRQTYTNRAMGSPITVAIDSTSPGSGGPKSHVHRFEQVYFMVDGETTVMYGLDNPKAKKNDIVIIPAGVVHTNSNQSTAIERHITLLLPEPAQMPFDIEFEEKGPAAPSGGAAPSGAAAPTDTPLLKF